MATTVSPLQDHQPYPQVAAARETLSKKHPSGPIVVATDGTCSSDSALATAAMIASARNAHAELVSVVEPLATVVGAPALVGFPSSVDTDRIEERREQIREQRHLVGGGGGWPVAVELGHPATTIARIAKDRSAQLIIMGLNKHGVLDRVFGGDTVFDVIRTCNSPVLVTPHPMEQMPTTVVVGVNFDSLSLVAARTVVELFPSIDTIYLVHVGPSMEDYLVEGWTAHDFAYKAAVARGFSFLRRKLEQNSDLRVKTVFKPGTPAAELPRFAKGIDADILVVAIHRRGLLRRLATGTIAGRVLRTADCPVLVVPEPPAREATPADGLESGARKRSAEAIG